MNTTIRMQAASYQTKWLPVVPSWFHDLTDDRPGAQGGER